MELTPHQKNIIIEARTIVARLVAAGGELASITGDEAGVLLDMIAIMEEHQASSPGDDLFDIIDRHLDL